MRKLILPVLFLLLAGLATISSISLRLFYAQLAFTLVGLVLMFVLTRLDWRTFLRHNWFIWGLYLLSLGLLVLTYFIAPVVRNTRSWLFIGSFGFQPVELTKIALILVYASFFSRRHLAVARWQTIIVSFLLFAIPGGLVALQPDLGSASILFGIWFGFLLVSGLPFRRLTVALIFFLIAGAIAWSWGFKDYQRARIIAVFYPEQNSLTVNYSTIQSKIAVGSAGFWGKGYKQGSQTQLGFLTEPANDYALAAFIEEWGMGLGLLVVAIFFYLVYQILRVGMFASQNFEKFFCLGTAMVFGLHFLINAGSTLGIFPVVGVTFPFLSYGGSSLLSDFLLLAVVNAIGRRVG